MADHDDLPFGLYERLITAGLRTRLLRFDPTRARVVTADSTPPRPTATLARHIRGMVARALDGSPARRSRLSGRRNSPTRSSNYGRRCGRADIDDDTIETPPEQLRAILPVTGLPRRRDRRCRTIGRPVGVGPPVNARGEPALAHALAHEIPSADSIDLLCAFVRWHGLRLLDAAHRALPRGRPPARHHHRLHRVHRAQGAGLAGDASARRSRCPTTRSPRACMRRRGSSAAPPASPRPTSARRTCRSPRCSTAWSGTCGCRRWGRRTSSRSSTPRSTATGRARNTNPTTGPRRRTLRPGGLRRARRLAGRAAPLPGCRAVAAPARDPGESWPPSAIGHHRWKNLVVAATGTGKTIVAALDYKRLRDQIRRPAPAVCGAPAGRS